MGAATGFGGSLLADMLTSVEDIDFDFENSQIRVVVMREIPETPRMMKLSSTKVGQELEVPAEVDVGHRSAVRNRHRTAYRPCLH